MIKFVLLFCVLFYPVSTLAVDCVSTGAIILSTQEDVDNFQSKYGAGVTCDTVATHLLIKDGSWRGGTPISDLSGLSALVEVKGDLVLGPGPSLTDASHLAGIEKVGGILSIEDTGQTDLKGLSGIKSIGSDLLIEKNDDLLDLTGLEGVIEINGRVILTQNSALKNLNGLTNLKKVLGNLTISGNSNLDSLNGLNILSNVGGSFSLYGNPEITDIDALSNLTEIGHDFAIFGCDSLEDIAGLSSLTHVGQSLGIGDNESLTEISGLSNLADVAEIQVYGNASLIDISGFNAIEKLTGWFIISDNEKLEKISGFSQLFQVLNHFSIVNNPRLKSMDGFSRLSQVDGNLELRRNSLITEINSFHELSYIGQTLIVNFNDSLTSLPYLPANVEVGALRIIGNAALHNLNNAIVFSQLGDLEISYNDSLETLNGLENLSEIVQNLTITNNKALESISGLSRLREIGASLEISNLRALKNLDGLDQLTKVGGQFWLRSNSIEGIQALSNLRNPGSLLWIEGNGHLISLSGLEGLSFVEHLRVYGAHSLVNLKGLENLTQAGKLEIQQNNSLLTLNGLSNLTEVDEIMIQYNWSLKEIDGLVGLESAGVVDIFQNGELESVDGLANLKTVQFLRIDGNHNLREIRALSSLKSVHSLVISSNNRLSEIGELANISSVDKIEIYRNPLLDSLAAFSSLIHVGYSLNIQENHNLRNLDGLSSLLYVGGSKYAGGLMILKNRALENVNGLSSLTEIGGQLQIHENPVLTNLNGLSGLTKSGMVLSVWGNESLEDCTGLIPVLDDIDDANPGPGPGEAGIPDIEGDMALYGNSESCNSIDTILATDVSATFLVNKVFSDANSSAVDISLVCENPTTLISVIDHQASQGSPARFELSRFVPGFKNRCSAVEVSMYESYVAHEAACRDIAIADGSVVNCLITNHKDMGKITVSKEFTDGNRAAVAVELECQQGTVLSKTDFASMRQPAEFFISDIQKNGTLCSVTEIMPPGYEQSAANCSDLVVTPGSEVRCTVTNQLLYPVELDPSGITSSWYDPASSGEGFMIHSVSQNLNVGYFYGFDQSGQRLWLIGTSEDQLKWGSPLVFNAQHVLGGSFTDFNSDLVTRSDWGTWSFTQWDCDSGTVVLDGMHGQKKMEVVRLAATSGTKCSQASRVTETDAVTGSWYENQTSGQGFSIHKINNDRGVVYFYGFDDLGANQWLIGTWEEGFDWHREIRIPMQQVDGGSFDEVTPSDIVREEWGTLTLRFDSCSSGWARLEGLNGVQELDLELLAGSIGLKCEHPQ